MSKITEELRELAQIADILGKANGSVEVRTTRSPDYGDRDLFKKLKETVQEKIEALAGIPDEEYVAMVTGADKKTTIVGGLMTAKELGETIGRVQERMAKGASFSEAALPEIVEETKEKQAEEFFDSIEKDTVKT